MNTQQRRSNQPPVKHGAFQRGAAAVEYALLIALVAIVCIASINRLNNVAASKYSQTAVAIGQ